MSTTIQFSDSATIHLDPDGQYYGVGTIDADDEVGGTIMDHSNGYSYPGTMAGPLTADVQPGLWDWTLDYDFNAVDLAILGYPPPGPNDDLVEYVWDMEQPGDRCRTVTWGGYGSPGAQMGRAHRIQRTLSFLSTLCARKVSVPKLIMHPIRDPGKDNLKANIPVTVELPKEYAALVCLSLLPAPASGKLVQAIPLPAPKSGKRSVTFKGINVKAAKSVLVSVVVKRHRAKPVSQRLKPYDKTVHGNPP